MKLWYARKACRKLTIIELEIYAQYVDELRALQILKLGMYTTLWNYDMHAKRATNEPVLS